MTTTQNFYSQTLIASCEKLKLKMFMKILAKVKKFFVLVIIQLSQNIMMIRTN